MSNVTTVQCLERVINNCFTIIDKNAKKVLESDEFEDIDLELLNQIISRDGLELPSGKVMPFKGSEFSFSMMVYRGP